MRPKVGAVVVTFHPDREKLKRLLDSLRQQADAVVIVDNGSKGDSPCWLAPHQGAAPCGPAGQPNEEARAPLAFIPLEENAGVAAAQNIGITRLRDFGVAYVILFDHDSLPASGMVDRLVKVAEQKRAAGIKLAAVGPRYWDERQGNPPPFIMQRGIRITRMPCSAEDSVVEVSYLISSGCLIPLDTLDLVGLMREDFFIDYVDIEWGLRAQCRGFTSFGVCDALMRHELGEEPIKFFRRRVPLHSPLRHYYHFRNAVAMYLDAGLPLRWKVADGWRLFLKYGFYTMFAQPRHIHWWMMTKGVWHGLVGRMGRYS